MSRHSFNDYEWLSDNELAGGAQGHVYRGQHKLTGEPVAIKVASQSDHVAIERELSTLQSVTNEHILRVLSHGTHPTMGKHIIVTELCSAGSLQEYLNLSQNKFGLDDEDILLLLECLSEAFQTMRNRKEVIVHRDVKPGNICLHISDEKPKCFKLIDFGMARFLNEDESSESIRGTPYYCHVNVFERYLGMEVDVVKNNQILDLWSIGVTLYYAATGTLPFVIENTRSTFSNLWIQMCHEKPPGHVRGEKKGNKSIFYESLPENLTMTKSLATAITPMLALLLNSDESTCWNFPAFFNECNTVLSLKRVTLFCTNTGLTEIAYIKEINYASLYEQFRLVFPSLKNDVSKQKETFHIFHNGHKLSRQEDDENATNFYTQFAPTKQLFLFVTANNLLDEKNLKINYLEEPKYPILNSNVHANTRMKDCAIYLFSCQRLLKIFSYAAVHYPIAVDNVAHDLMQQIREILIHVELALKSNPTNEALQSKWRELQKYLSANQCRASWMRMMSEVGVNPNVGKKQNVMNMPFIAESLLKANNTMADGNLQRCVVMCQDMRIYYRNEVNYFSKLRLAYYKWSNEIHERYSWVAECQKLCDCQSVVSVGQSQADSEALPINPLMQFELEKLLRKAVTLKSGLLELKNLTEGTSISKID